MQHGTDHFFGREQEVQNLMAFARKGLAVKRASGFVTGEAAWAKPRWWKRCSGV
jgi:hypothetical protein